jgi:hypothetical protein
MDPDPGEAQKHADPDLARIPNTAMNSILSAPRVAQLFFKIKLNVKVLRHTLC